MDGKISIINKKLKEIFKYKYKFIVYYIYKSL